MNRGSPDTGTAVPPPEVTAFQNSPTIEQIGLQPSSTACDRLVSVHRFDFLVSAWSFAYANNEPFSEFDVKEPADNCTTHRRSEQSNVRRDDCSRQNEPGRSTSAQGTAPNSAGGFRCLVAAS
jgi:hypothetical protein